MGGGALNPGLKEWGGGTESGTEGMEGTESGTKEMGVLNPGLKEWRDSIRD